MIQGFQEDKVLGIFSSSQMGCLQDNSLWTFIVYNIPGVDLIMEYIYMRIAVRKWSIDLKQIVQFMYRHVPTLALRRYAIEIFLCNPNLPLLG
jgi:hypothetical protein